MSNLGIKASDLLVQALEAEGVKHIFAVPGEENLDFVESLRKSSIKLVLTRHEQGAGFMATTYGRLTGRADQLKVGNAILAETECGPLVNPNEVERVEQWVKEAVDGGAQVLCGGKKLGKITCAPPCC